MDKDVFIKSDIGAQAAWKGFSSQTLYIAYRLVTDIQGYEYYPEEIEDKLNNLPYVAESIIVQQNEKLVGLVYPDFDDAFAHGLKNEDIEQVMEENRVTLNTMLPAYSQISKMKIYPEEFEKTPKRSIKRYLYQPAEEN